MRHVLWEHHPPPGRLVNLLSYDSNGGAVAIWDPGSGQTFVRWLGVAEEVPLRPAWSAPDDPAYWARMVKRLLEEPLHGSACPLHQPIVGCPATCRGEAYPDAIVCYSWTDNRLQVAVARTTLIEESATETPDWYLTGKQPKPKGVKIAPSGKRLIWEGLPRTEVLWKVVGSDTFVWATHGVHGVLPSKLVGITTPSMLTGKVEPAAVLNSSIEVKGVATVPEGFELKNLIVRNEDGTWSPAPVLVGPKLVLISAPPVE